MRSSWIERGPESNDRSLTKERRAHRHREKKARRRWRKSLESCRPKSRTADGHRSRDEEGHSLRALLTPEFQPFGL